MCIYKAEDGKCKKFSNDEITSYCAESPCEFEKLSNYDRIKSMSVEEMADIIFDIYKQGFFDAVHSDDVTEREEIIKWLLQEVSDE